MRVDEVSAGTVDLLQLLLRLLLVVVLVVVDVLDARSSRQLYSRCRQQQQHAVNSLVTANDHQLFTATSSNLDYTEQPVIHRPTLIYS